MILTLSHTQKLLFACYQAHVGPVDLDLNTESLNGEHWWVVAWYQVLREQHQLLVKVER